MPDFGAPIGYEKLTVSNSVKTLTAGKYRHFSDEVAVGATNALVSARSALITTEATNGLRFTLDGTAPVAGTTGHLLAGGSSLTLSGFGSLVNFKAIRESASDAVIHVTYFA